MPWQPAQAQGQGMLSGHTRAVTSRLSPCAGCWAAGAVPVILSGLSHCLAGPVLQPERGSGCRACLLSESLLPSPSPSSPSPLPLSNETYPVSLSHSPLAPCPFTLALSPTSPLFSPTFSVSNSLLPSSPFPPIPLSPSQGLSPTSMKFRLPHTPPLSRSFARA